MESGHLGERTWELHLAAKPVLVAGLAAALVDACYFSATAFLKGNSPLSVLKSIAGFWPKSMSSGGDGTAAVMGLVTHVGLATIMAAAFLMVRPSLPWLRGSVLQAGLVWGAILYIVMYLVVLPLRWPTIFPRWDGLTSIFDIVVHLLVGLSIAAVIGFTASAREY